MNTFEKITLKHYEMNAEILNHLKSKGSKYKTTLAKISGVDMAIMSRFTQKGIAPSYKAAEAMYKSLARTDKVFSKLEIHEN